MHGSKLMSRDLPVDRPWRPDLNWDTKPGHALSALMAGLHGAGGEWLVSVFGSAPLQMAYARGFIGNDVHTSVVWQREPEFERVIREIRLGRDQAEPSPARRPPSARARNGRTAPFAKSGAM
jgi:hypothetical protein